MTIVADVLVVGAGPAGSAAACSLAQQGHRVLVVERRPFPRPKACGDSLTPTAVQAVEALGLDLGPAHRIDGVVLTDADRRRTIDWAARQGRPAVGRAIRRETLDERLARHAVAAGAELLEGHEAIEPVVERGLVRGAVVRSALGQELTIRSTYLVVADGANSTFGRALGTSRARTWPHGTALRAYWEAEAHGTHRHELGLGLGEPGHESVPGFGWVVPLGDGTVNVGVSVIGSAVADVRAVNTARLLDTWAAEVAERWGFDPRHPLTTPAAGRLAIGGSVEPKAGPTFLVVGDAAGTGSPLLGTGIDTALTSGMLAADVVHDALGTGGPTALQRYPRELAHQHGEFWKLGRLAVRAMSRPPVARRVARMATGRGTTAEVLMRLALDERHDDGGGAAEALFRAGAALSRFAPDA
jgi:geranylgeranyl reductase family protein